MPIEIGVGSIVNGQVSVTLYMDGPADEDTAVAIGCTNTSWFSDLPPSVTVPQGQSSFTFYATVSSSYVGGALLTATSHSVSVLSEELIGAQLKPLNVLF